MTDSRSIAWIDICTYKYYKSCIGIAYLLPSGSARIQLHTANQQSNLVTIKGQVSHTAAIGFLGESPVTVSRSIGFLGESSQCYSSVTHSYRFLGVPRHTAHARA